MKVNATNALTINAPEVFEDAEFQAWLNNSERKFTWHQGGTPDEWSDVVVLVDPGLTGDGPDSNMPEHIWDNLVEICRQHFKPARGVASDHIMIRLTNVD